MFGLVLTGESVRGCRPRCLGSEVAGRVNKQFLVCLKTNNGAMLPVVFHFQFVLLRLLLLKFLEEPDEFPCGVSLHRREV